MGATVTVSDPGAGKTVTVDARTADLLHLTFDPADTIVDLDHGNLTIAFPSGGTVVIQSLGDAAKQGLPLIELQDNTVLEPLELLEALMLDANDIEPSIGLYTRL